MLIFSVRDKTNFFLLRVREKKSLKSTAIDNPIFNVCLRNAICAILLISERLRPTRSYKYQGVCASIYLLFCQLLRLLATTLPYGFIPPVSLLFDFMTIYIIFIFPNAFTLHSLLSVQWFLSASISILLLSQTVA